ncbi:hypothetical protein BJX99DRAFT_261115 [Aspergillus californicus]
MTKLETRCMPPIYNLDQAGRAVFTLHRVPRALILLLQRKHVHPDILSGLIQMFRAQTSLSDGDNTADTEDNTLRVRANTERLMGDSRYFGRKLKGGIREGSDSRKTSDYEFDIPCCPVTFLLMLMVIHCDTHLVPRSVSLQTLHDMATLAHHFECEPVMLYFSNLWIDSLLGTISSNINDDTSRWFWIAWVFQKREILFQITHILITESETPLKTEDWSIPHEIIERINAQRVGYIQSLIDTLLYDTLFEVQRGCLRLNGDDDNYAGHAAKQMCTYAVLGAFTQKLVEMDILPSEPVGPFNGISISNILRVCTEMQSPAFETSGSFAAHRQCSLGHRMTDFLEFYCTPMGLEIDDVDIADLSGFITD